MKKYFVLLAIAAILVIVCGCAQSIPPVQNTSVTTPSQTTQQPVGTTASKTTASVSDNTIQIKNFTFDPSTITVKAGSAVRWVNKDSVAHKLQFADAGFSTQILGASQSESHIFAVAGVYSYICSIHPSMKGTVIVE
jgi:plastocyanin